VDFAQDVMWTGKSHKGLIPTAKLFLAPKQTLTGSEYLRLHMKIGENVP
jgi:hypothetical protein